MATQNIFNLTDTWNNVVTTFTAIKMNATDTASDAGSLLIDLQVGGSSKFYVKKNGEIFGSFINLGTSTGAASLCYHHAGLALGSAGLVSWSSSGPGTPDLSVFRDAADTLAQRRGTNAQAFRVYNTYTDASNYERLSIGVVTANRFQISSVAAGTGTMRPLDIGGSGVNIQPAGIGADTGRINFTTTGIMFQTDNAFDIGASGATRPRNIYAGTLIAASALTATGSVTAGAGSFLRTGNGNAQIGAPSDGVVLLFNSSGSDFGRLQFGGTTSSFPCLKRNGAELQCRLADDSALTDFSAKSIDLTGTLRSSGRVQAAYSVGIPAGGTTNLGLTVSSTSNFGVFFGSGAPTLSAAKGSLYLRSDGSGVNDRMYVNTDGSTTWTAVVTVA